MVSPSMAQQKQPLLKNVKAANKFIKVNLFSALKSLALRGFLIY